MSSRASVAALLVTLAACECGGQPAEREAQPGEAAPLSAYFPSAPGDRWRYAAGDERATRSVVDVSPVEGEEGTEQVVIMGTDLMGPRYHHVSDEAVTLVDPEGEVVGTLLDAPLELGHRWTYVFGDVGCEAEYTSVNEVVEVAGLTLNACVEVERTCTHPAGKPFPVETAEIHEEVYCPMVGRVSERTRIEPPPPGSESAERDDRLVFYRVAESPAPEVPESFGCDAFLLVRTDVAAACTRPVHQLGEEHTEHGCRASFGEPDAPPLVVEARRFDRDARPADADALVTAAAALVGTEEIASYGYIEGSHAIAVASPTELCPSDSLARLGPLVKSLVRR